MEKKFKVTFGSGRIEEKTEFEIRSEFNKLTSEFKMLLFRMKFSEELYHNDTKTSFKRLS